MIHTLFNWLSLDAQNVIAQVWWCVAILWAVLVAISLLDVAGNTLFRSTKVLWSAAIILLPFGGLLAYCLFNLWRAEYYLLEFLPWKRRGRHLKNNRQLHSKMPHS